MLTKNKKNNIYQCEIVNINDIVPENHILRIIEKEFDFTFIYDYVESLYSPFGRPSIGYIIYKANKNDCNNCPFKNQCTKMNVKQITRHVWEKYKEIVMNEYCHRDDVREVYKTRNQHIERVFADGKQKHGLRYTLFKGKRKVQAEIGLIFAYMNLKKYASHIRKESSKNGHFCEKTAVFTILIKFLYQIKNKAKFVFTKITLSTVCNGKIFSFLYVII